MNCIAHVQKDDTGNRYFQTAVSHCRNTAGFAGESLEKVSLLYPAYLAGLLHDMGKFKDEFQKYILENIGVRGNVIHTFAGARYILETFRKARSSEGDDAQDLSAELIAYAVAAHHGVFDIEKGGTENGFLHRLDCKNCCYEESRDTFFSECAGKTEIDVLMKQAADQTAEAIEKILSLPGADENGATDEEISFYMGILERLILSAVIDGDQSDTAAFMGDTELKSSTIKIDWNKYLSLVENKLLSLPAEKPIDIARRKISDQCRICADHPGKIMRLNVPTGGRKTLSSLRYALAYAANWDKSRIIFTAPLLTILEQNTKVLREYIQDDSIILEHHSNVINAGGHAETLNEYELYAESWNAPVIITTMVQLLNTMFSAKTASIRRFHSLADSIIVIDEVQTVPLKLLSLFNLMINFLAGVCEATIVLCSATQPCLEQIEHPMTYTPNEIVPYDPDLWNVFRRTEIIDGGNRRLEDVPELALSILEKADSLLIVCNKKKEAAMLYDALKGSGNCFHLSASMCPEHRRKVLNAVYDSLGSCINKTICIATQVIEAGVHISFGAVIRFAAGMDSVIQSAGRCNRNAECKTSAPVYILRIVDEDLRALEEIKRGKESTIDLLGQYKTDPESFDNDLASDASIKYYYRKLYERLSRKATEFPVGNDTIYNLLSTNTHNCTADSTYYYQQAFKAAGDAFKVFDDNSMDVIVPYGKGVEIIDALESPRSTHDFKNSGGNSR